jgi:AraC-like DNA-binding protein
VESIAVLSTRLILERDGVEISDVACREEQGRGAEVEHSSALRLVFVRRGVFVRSVEGHERVHDSTTAFWMRPGEAQRYDHPHAGGDDCTSIAFTTGQHLEALADGRDELPRGLVHTTASVDAEHRLVLASATRAYADADEVVERVLALADDALAQVRAPARHERARAGTARRREALADGVREALAADPNLSLVDLARLLSVSPHHLSRTFRSVAGHTIARHRMRLRTRTALELIGDGEQDLARVAADAGFADQSHLSRVMRAEAARAPGAMRALLTQ